MNSLNSVQNSYSNGYHNGESQNGDQDEFEEEEEEAMTPAELVLRLQQCWLNEKWAPELLEQKTEIIEYVIEQIKFMENNIRSARKGDFRIPIHKLELDRIKFMLHSYLRIRIKKIEQFASAILEEDQSRKRNKLSSKLSPEEFAYATQYLKNMSSHLKASILDNLPPNLRELNENVTMPKPDLDKFVFLRSTTNISGILTDEDFSGGARSDNSIVDMNKDDLYVMRYKPIRNYLYTDQIQLI